MRLPLPLPLPPHSGRWLAIATAVVGAHAAILGSLWQGSPPSADDTGEHVLEGALVPPMQAVSERPSTATRPRPSLRSVPRAATPRAQGDTATHATPAVTAQPGTSLSDTTTAGLPDTPTSPLARDEPPAQPLPAVALHTAPVDDPAAPSDHAAPLYTPPGPVQWTYEVTGSSKGFSYSANATLSWRTNATHYDLQLEVRTFLLGTRRQHSTGSLVKQGLRPEQFSDKGRKERQITFDWEQHTLQTPDQAALPLSEGTQDRLSMFLQLASLLARLHEPPAAGQAWNLHIASFAGAEPWVFIYQGAHVLDLPVGPVPTWKLQRSPRHPGDQTIELWFAPGLQHLPVRIRLSDANGDVIDQRLSAQ